MAIDLRIFVSSPADVGVERARLQEVFAGLDAEYAEQASISRVFWEEQFYAANRGGFQDQIGSAAECDLVLCLLWKRLGSFLPAAFNRPDGSARTGTEYEFETAMEAAARNQRPDILVFRKTAPLQIAQERYGEEFSQYEALQSFWTRSMRDEQGHFTGSYKTFETPDELVTIVTRDLRSWLRERLRLTTWDRGSPYRGLAAFEVEHAPIFFGRERAVAEIRARLTASAQGERPLPFLLIVGPSGAGKSSVIRAGLVPDLVDRRRAPGIDVWRPCVTRPGLLAPDIESGLAGALFATGVLSELGEGDNDTPEALADYWRACRSQSGMAARPIVAALDRVARSREREGDYSRRPTTALLLLIDQFEEVFQLAEAAQAGLARLLTELAASGRIWIAATMRSDFYPQLYGSPELMSLKSGGRQYDFGAPRGHELADMIRKPAAAAGLRFEVREGRTLDDVLLDEASAQPASLPLLEFMLERLYAMRHTDRGELTFAAYEQLGGLEGAIAIRAEESYAALARPESLGDRVEHAFRSVMAEIVTVDEEGKVVRRWVPRHVLDGDPASRQFIEAFLDARLLVADVRVGDEEPVVSVAHEAVFKRWPRARTWIDHDREFMIWRRRLQADLANWRRVDQDAGSLLRGMALVDAERWLDVRRDNLDDPERSYIEAGLALRGQELAARAEEERRLKDAYEAAERQRVVALARQLAAEAELARTRQGNLLQRSALLASESMRRHPTPEASHVLRQALALLPRLMSRATTQDILFCADGRYVLAGDRPVVSLSNHEQRPDARGALSRDAGLVGGLGGPTAWVRHVQSGRTVATAHVGRPITALDLTPDGDAFAIGAEDGTVLVCSSEGGTERARLKRDGVVGTLCFSGDGRYLAAAGGSHWADDANAVTVWNLAGQHGVSITSGRPNFALFHPAGGYLVTAELGVQRSPDGVLVQMWRFTGRRETWKAVRPVWSASFRDMLMRLVFSADGRFLGAASREGFGIVWDAVTGVEHLRLRHENAVVDIAFSPTGDRVATAGWDGTARLWDIQKGHEVARVAVDGEITSVAFSPEGTQWATGAGDGSVLVWDAAVRPTRALLQSTGRTIGCLFNRTGDYEGQVGAQQRGHLRDHCLVLAEDALFTATSSDPAPAWGWETASVGNDAASDFPSASFVERLGSLCWAATAPRGQERTDPEIARFIDHAQRSGKVALSPERRYIATADGAFLSVGQSADRPVRRARVWMMQGGAAVAELDHATKVKVVAFSPDEIYLATASDDGDVRIWGCGDWTLKGILPHPGEVSALVFGPGGARLVSVWQAKGDHFVSVWDVCQQRQLAAIPFESRVGRLAISPDQRYIATPHADGVVRVFEIDSESEVARINQPGLIAVEFNADGRLLAALCDTKDEAGMRRWKMTISWWRPADLLAAAAQRVSRNLTPAEWKQYLGNEPYTKTFPMLP